MLFSVVIPTHDRLKLLADGVETIRRQNKANWELVVFDNASANPIADFVRGLADDRIRFERSDEFLPVTDSWNRAIDLARGDFVILLGDDDGLTPRYFERLEAVINEFQRPEVVYSAIYQFMHPGVAPWDPSGYVADVRNGFFFAGRDKPFRLSRKQAKRAVGGSLHFSRNFTFNIQAFAFSRTFLSTLRAKGAIFRSPFPDYYMANVAFALSKSTVVVPEPLAIAGISKASFGYTLFNDLEAKGESILNAKLADDPIFRELKPQLLPGPAYILNYVVTMEYVSRVTAGELGMKVDYPGYRRRQIFATLRAVSMGLSGAGAQWQQIQSRLSPAEHAWAFMTKVLFMLGKRTGRLGKALIEICSWRMSYRGHKAAQRICDRGGFSRAIDLYEALDMSMLKGDDLVG
jgi:glycosyltransferase involved in cell wall biosynthesis